MATAIDNLIAEKTVDTTRQKQVFPEEVKVFSDGGSRGNPGPSASGFVILDMEDNVLVDKGVYLGITTNNQAEYMALKLALEECRKIGVVEAQVYLDSLLVVNQMKGIFKVKNRDLWPIHDAIQQLSKQFRKISFSHVPREFNKLADAAVNRALDEQLGILPESTEIVQ
jgi:ribonuclease HI